MCTAPLTPGCRSVPRPLCKATFSPAGSHAAQPSSSTWRPAKCWLRSAIRGRPPPTCSSAQPFRRPHRLPSAFLIVHGMACIRRARRSSCWSPPPRSARRPSMSMRRLPASDCRTAVSATTCTDRRGRFATIRWTRRRTARSTCTVVSSSRAMPTLPSWRCTSGRSRCSTRLHSSKSMWLSRQRRRRCVARFRKPATGRAKSSCRR